jgi:hypothetical protein
LHNLSGQALKALGRQRITQMNVRLPQLSIAFIALLLSACVFDDDWDADGDQNQTKNFTFHAVDEVDVEGGIKGDFDGFMTFSGDIELPTAVETNLTRIDAGLSHDRDLVGFICERPALNDGKTALEIANALELKLSRSASSGDEILTRLASSSTVSEQTFAGLGAVTKRINLLFSGQTGPTPTSLALSLAQLFGVNKENGSVENWPSEDSDEPLAFEYTLYLTVIYVNESQVVTMASVAPRDVASAYTHLLRSTTTPTNITQTGVDIDNESQSYTAAGGGGLADFLFVVDNSGSMGRYQTAVKNAADIFSETMQSSGLDFEIATITTDSAEFRDTNADGGFTKNFDEFKNDISAGTSGSANERGIFFAEQSLLSLAKGDSSDGTVSLANHPRNNAGLSVIILSDEASHYGSNPEFDSNNNLFIDRGYRVYSILNPSENARSQYDDLSNASGGSIADINSIDNFTDIFTEIATLAGAASSRYALDFTPIESTIEVKVNGSSKERSNSNGWQYIAGSNAILFKGSSVPQENDKVSVSYGHLPVQTWFVQPAASSIDATFNR